MCNFVSCMYASIFVRLVLYSQMKLLSSDMQICPPHLTYVYKFLPIHGGIVSDKPLQYISVNIHLFHWLNELRHTHT